MSGNIRIIRNSLNLKQSTVADYIGISLTSYCHKESAKRDFTLTEMKKIQELFGKNGAAYTIDEIFFANSVTITET